MEEKAMQARNPSLQAAALDYLGTIARNEGALEKAIYFYRKALVVCGKIADNGPPITAIRQFVTLNNLGIVYRMQNIFDKAEKCYIEAIELIRSKIGKDSLIELEPCINLIKLYLRNGKIENAEKVYSMMTHNISDDLHRLMDLDIQIEILDARRSDPTKLVSTIKELIKLSNKLGIVRREAYGWQNLGIIYQYDLNDINEALVCFDQAIDLLKRRDFQSQLADVLRDRAYVRFELKNLDGAYKDITQALQLFEQNLNLLSGTFKKHQRLIKLIGIF
jgi:tetratricopeptide (TPR) repeat protein